VPNILQPSHQRLRYDFVASVPLDLLNAMYFTFLAGELEGIEPWPIETRRRMDPALRAELDLLLSYPRQQPGIVGALNDTLFVHRSRIADIDSLLEFVRTMPAEGTESPHEPGIQGLAIYALRWPGGQPFVLPAGMPARDALAARLAGPPDDDLTTCAATADIGGAKTVLALFDDPEQVRARLLALIRRFYDEHYRADEERRLACMQRSVAFHRDQPVRDVDGLLRALTGRHISCLQEVPAAYTDFVFVPSVDTGPYNSCADLPPVHGLHYPCETRFTREDSAHPADDTHRIALVYRALGDEQRLQILRLLRDGELYATEIVERTGIHQSAVSRHLAFMKAVGLVNVRPQNNMKFYSLNSEISRDLRHVVELFVGAMPVAKGGTS
jgi:ArsR family transcriptional regulator